MASACVSENELLAFVSGTADAATSARLERHVDECSACRELLAEAVRALHPVDDGAGGGPIAPSMTDAPDDPAAPGRLVAGASIGRYVVEEVLGAGGMG